MTDKNQFYSFDAKLVKEEIVSWIKAYFEENGKGCKAVVGISGGKDSSIVAALCVEALGKDRVYGVLMPRGHQFDIDASYRLCRELEIEYIEINIEGMSNAALSALSGLKLNDVVTTNLPARIRMTMLYAVSASVNGRVANTCNLSEDYVGFATKFGDGAGDFSPLSSLTVAEVKQIGYQLNLSEILIEKVPIDGLTDKTDEDNFGFTYAMLDKYIRTGICEDGSIKEKIGRMHKNNLHKINPMPKFEFNP